MVPNSQPACPLGPEISHKAGEGGGQSVCRLAPDALAALQAYDFPGNVRELRNLLQQAALRCRDGFIHAADLRLPVMHPPAVPPAPLLPRASAASLRDLERIHLQSLLDAHGGHRARVAAALGITERTLYRKLKQHGLGR